MSVAFKCHECGRELRVNERSIGRRVRCPGCATLVVVPEPSAAEPGADDLVEIADVEGQSEEPPVELEPIAEVEPSAEPPRLVVPPPPDAPAARSPSKKPAKSEHSAAETAAMLLPRRGQPEDLIDMTAMVDIVFFLLIFFLVTSLQALESVMDLPTPQSAEGGAASSRSVADLENDPDYITVRIEDDDSIWVEDTQVFNDQELSLKLRAARRETERPRSLLVIGDADATHGAAVRVFDAGAGAGVSSISLLVQEKSQ